MENQKAKQPDSNKGILYDFIFIGLGAGNSLILLSLIKEACVVNKKIAIIEPDLKDKNDKTYCFWALPNDPIVKDLNQIISYTYTSIEVNGSVLQNIENQPYYYTKSIDLYNHTLETLLKSNISIYRKAVLDLVCNDDDLYSIKTDDVEFKSRFIFDSRPPQANQISKEDIYLNQSFYGLHIRCKNEVFNPRTFQMMDFNVDQDEYTQFIYTLPFSSQEALIELTRFGVEKIEIEYAKKILDNKLKNSYGDYEILSDEAGCIPMTTFINPYNKFKGVLNTGASANLIKPSTGYGIKNMYEFAKIVTERIKDENFKLFNQISLKRKKRFRFYDNLLLIILLLWPGEGYKIFTQLFKRQKIHRIFTFLDEKTSLSQEIKIFSTLPIIPFLRALYVYIRKLSWYRFALAAVSVLIYFLFVFLPNDTAVNISYVVILIGLLLIGIPHGAVDHLLQKDKKIALLPFVLNYLFIVVLYFIVWQFLPLFSLLFFIVYSSFHFGESEFEEMGIKIVSTAYYLKAILLGFSILSFIILTHFGEAIDIVSSINGLQFAQSIGKDFTDNIYVFAVLSFVCILSQIQFRKKQSSFLLIFILLIGLKLPLIVAFALYFIFQHSYNAWRHLQVGLSMSSVSLYKKALPFTLGALLVFVILLLPGKIKLDSSEGVIGYFFIFLACISLPHFLIMHIFYRNTALN